MLACSHQISGYGYPMNHLLPVQSGTARASSVPIGLHRDQPEVPGRRNDNVAKRVHWASDVRDNDDRYFSQLRSTMKTSRSPSMKLSPSFPRPLTPANSSAQIVRESVPEDSENLTTPAFANMSKPRAPIPWQGPDEVISRRRPRSLPSPLQSEGHVASPKRSTRSRGHQTKDFQRTGGSEVGASTNSPSKRSLSSVKQQSAHVSELLPQVPDAPLFERLSPATPRPARLPTPDLDDFCDREFCSCDSSTCRGSDVQGSWGGGFTSKMNAQLQAAQEYIQSRRN